MRLFLNLIIFVSVLLSCTGKSRNFVVKYSVEGAENRQLYLSRRTLAGTVEVDSVFPGKSGTYTLKGYTQIPDFFILYFQPGQYINLIIHPGDHITVKGNATAFDHGYYIEGSKDSRLVQTMVSRQAVTLHEIAEISAEYENSRDRPDFATIKSRIDSTYDQIVEEHRKFSMEFIEENPGSLASLMALYQQLGRNIQVFGYKDDFAYYEMVDSILTVLYPDSEAVQDLNRKVTEIRHMLRIDIGSPAPEIVLPDTTGREIALSGLKGNAVLLYFYASWSHESLSQNEILSDLYAEYPNHNLEYYQVSLDRTKESWMRCLREEKPEGIQVSDLKYWDSPVVETYMIEEIPQMFLLDKEGRIIDKGFSAEEAEERIYNLLVNSKTSGSNQNYY